VERGQKRRESCKRNYYMDSSRVTREVIIIESLWDPRSMCCSVLQCIAVCCSALQCVAVCCSVLQCVAVGFHNRESILPWGALLAVPSPISPAFCPAWPQYSRCDCYHLHHMTCHHYIPVCLRVSLHLCAAVLLLFSVALLLLPNQQGRGVRLYLPCPTICLHDGVFVHGERM